MNDCLQEFNKKMIKNLIKREDCFTYLVSRKIENGFKKEIVTAIFKGDKLKYCGFNWSADPNGFSAFDTTNEGIIYAEMPEGSINLRELVFDRFDDSTNIMGNQYNSYSEFLLDLRRAETELLFAASHYRFFKKYKNILKGILK
jgi:hypothetical protein